MSLSSHSPPISPSTSDLSPTHSPASARVLASEGETTAGLDGTELERSSLPQVCATFLLFTRRLSYENIADHCINLFVMAHTL